jgi:hypothetical protein
MSVGKNVCLQKSGRQNDGWQNFIWSNCLLAKCLLDTCFWSKMKLSKCHMIFDQKVVPFRYEFEKNIL